MEEHETISCHRWFHACSLAIAYVSKSLLRYKFAVACILVVASILPFLPAVAQPTQGDVRHYQSVAADLLAGKLPYRDFVLEYPPYAMPLFLLPRAFGDNDSYPTNFMLTVLAADWLIKLLLVFIGIRSSNTLRAFLPLLLYSLAIPAIHYFYLQRYDAWPALICIASICLIGFGEYCWGGLLLTIAIGVKLYPAVFAPPIFIFAVRQGKGKQFCIGLGLGLLPIILSGFFLPWWRFVEFQSSRGLQVESIYACVLWFAKLFHFIQLDWVFTRAWREIKGPAVLVTLPLARAIFIAAVIASVSFTSWIAVRMPLHLADLGGMSPKRPQIPLLARLLLIPLLAFVAFNQVLSPQYMIWLLPLAALASLDGNLYTVLLIPLATLLIPAFYPTNEYPTGLNFTETSILLLRDVILIIAWIRLAVEVKNTTAKLNFTKAPHTQSRGRMEKIEDI